jgi:hypothetical protein
VRAERHDLVSVDPQSREPPEGAPRVAKRRTWSTSANGASSECGITTVAIIREYPDAITSAGGRAACPQPRGTSAGWNNGRNRTTRSKDTVLPRAHPTRSMITDVGICGNSAEEPGSAARTHPAEPAAARTDLGGS